MRYFTESDTLFISGSFRAAGTGSSGGLRSAAWLLNHTAQPDTGDPERGLELAAAKAGIGTDFLALSGTVQPGHGVVLQYDFITVFMAAGIRREGGETGSITVIVTSSEGLSDSALLETIMVAAEAKAESLQSEGLPLTGTPADGIIAACEGAKRHRSAGRGTEAGRRVRECVLHGIPEALKRHDSGSAGSATGVPAFFIFSRFRGDHWIAWSPENCPYYPCHFEGQSCDFCYCPFYPCHDEQLGQWAESSTGGRVWNCARCTLLHEPSIAAYLKRYPGASREELIRRKENRIPGRNAGQS